MLDRDDIHRALIAFFGNAGKRGVFVGRYVLMPDHLHLFVAIAPGGQSLSRWVQILKIALAKPLRAEECSSPFWQKGFFDHVLRSAESYSRHWEYVRRNPVRAGLVKKAEDWPYQGEIFCLQL